MLKLQFLHGAKQIKNIGGVWKGSGMAWQWGAYISVSCYRNFWTCQKHWLLTWEALRRKLLVTHESPCGHRYGCSAHSSHMVQCTVKGSYLAMDSSALPNKKSQLDQGIHRECTHGCMHTQACVLNIITNRDHFYKHTPQHLECG